MPEEQPNGNGGSLVSRAKKDATYIILILAALSGSGYEVFFEGNGSERADKAYALLKQAHEALQAEHEELEDEVIYLRSRINELGMLFLGRPVAAEAPHVGRSPASAPAAAPPAMVSDEGAPDAPECKTSADCPEGFQCIDGHCLGGPPERVPWEKKDKAVKLPDTLEQAMQMQEAK